MCRKFEALIPEELRARFSEHGREAVAVAQLTIVGLCTPVRNDSSRASDLPTCPTYH